MYKKLLISSTILILSIFSFSTCFANNDLQNAADGVRNIVGGAENAIEDAAKDVSNASKNVTGRMEEGANNLGNDMMNRTNNTTTGVANNNNYTATRTATTTDNTLMGMNATAWTWLIIGIAAIAIVALVWYYSMQIRSADYNGRE